MAHVAMLLYDILVYRLDFVLFLIVAGTAYWLGRRVLKKHSVIQGHGVGMPLLIVSIVALGIWSAVDAENNKREMIRQMVGGLAPTFAYELEKLGHARIDFSTPADDPLYLSLIDRQKEWLKRNPNVIDIYTFRRAPDGRILLVVDSETDYNHDGVYSEERERRTPIGYEYLSAGEPNNRALAGEAVFDTTIVTDEWGTFVSFFQPMYDEHGRVEAALGIDMPAEIWISTLLMSRGGNLLVAFIILVIVVSSYVWLTVIKSEVTSRRVAEQEALRAKEAADKANQAKSDFLAAMSHEIRTPLNGILGFGSLLMNTPLNPEQRDYVHTLKTSADSLLELINDILDLSKIEAGRVTLEQIPFNLHKTLVEATTLLAPKATEKKLALSLESEADQNLHLLGDPVRLRQILLNLMSNAIKFTATGQVTLRVRWQAPETSSPDGLGRLRCEVIDTGIGIARADMDQLFRKFSQVDQSTTRRYGGSGLGLFISRRLAGMMGGDLTVESELGRGSTFTLEISARPCEAPAEIPGAENEAPANPDGSSGRVLLAEDTAINRKLMSIFLKKLGYSVDMAINGRECVELAAASDYDLIIMDCEMPELDGFSATRIIREKESANRHIPIIALTANALDGTEAKCLAAGMDAYLSKPVQPATLRNALDRFIRK